MSIKRVPGLAVLADDHGSPYAQIEHATGRVYSLDGVFTGQVLHRHGPSNDDAYPENGDRILSEFAALYFHAHVSKALGRPVKMRGTFGDEMLVTMDLAVSDVHIPAALPNYAAGYSLADGVADIVSPAIPVAKQSDYFFTWDSANAFKRVIPNAASPGGAVAEVNPTLSNTKFSTVEYALASFVPTEIDTNADAPLRPFNAAMMRVVNAHRLEREFRVATLLTTSGNWNSNNVTALGGTANWNGGSTSDPIKNMQDIQEKSFMKLTRWLFTEPAYHAFVRNPAVKSYWAFKSGDDTTVPSPEKLSAILRMAPILIADMKYSSGGAAAYVWPAAAGASSAVVALHEPPQNPPTSQEDVATSYTFRWTGANANVQDVQSMTAGFLVRSFWDPKRGARGGRQVVVVINDAETMTSNIVGGLITGVIQ